MGAIEELDRRLAAGEIVILDGGMGSELEAQGVPMNGAVWSGLAVLEHFDTVRSVHRDFIEAGADVVITNTYSSNRLALEPAGYGDRVVEINRRAVEAALQARDDAGRAVVVAGSMSPHSAYGPPAVEPGPDVILDSFREQAEALASAGVDLLALESVPSLAYGRPAAQAAIETGLPVWLGFTVWSRAFRNGDPDALVEPLIVPGIRVVNVMHTELELVDRVFDVVKRHWAGTLGAYPHVGEWHPPHWELGEIAPEAYATEAEAWIARGARLVGGCCGVRPAHIRALRDRLVQSPR